MKTHLKILSLFVVLTSVLMKSGDVFEGTEGEKVEIICPYPDGYTYTPKYLCRDPCGGSQHVLIKSEKTDQVVSDGRYSLINTVSRRIFTVTITDLRLKDSGVYYCGLDKWFKDTLKKVHLTVHQAAPVNRSSQTSEKTITTTITWTTTTLTSAVTSSLQTNDTFYKNNSTSYEQFSPTVQSKAESFFSVAVVCAGVLVLLVFGVFVASAFLCKRSHSTSRCLNSAVPENSVQDSPDLNQTVDDVHHIYDEMVTENSLAGPARDDNFSVIYSTVQYCGPAPQDDVNDFYSLMTHHTPHTEDK